MEKYKMAKFRNIMTLKSCWGWCVSVHNIICMNLQTLRGRNIREEKQWTWNKTDRLMPWSDWWPSNLGIYWIQFLGGSENIYFTRLNWCGEHRSFGTVFSLISVTWCCQWNPENACKCIWTAGSNRCMQLPLLHHLASCTEPIRG